MTWEEKFYELLADGVGTAEMVDFIKLKLIETRKKTIKECIREVNNSIDITESPLLFNISKFIKSKLTNLLKL